MTNFAPHEKQGIIDFMTNQADSSLVIKLANIITSNSIECPNVSVAIDAILLHSTSIQSILNRKLITKAVLFRYLHEKRVAVTEASTKQALIDRLIEYWNKHRREAIASEGHPQTHNLSSDHQPQIEPEPHPHEARSSSAVQHLTTSHFPIHEMSRSFAKWFFERLNAGTLCANDFWADAVCETNFYENKSIRLNETASSPEMVVQFLRTLREDYQLYMNLNDCDDGVQGRSDPHGLVLVLSCGTLHKTIEFVGTFEAVFGLLRDPFAQNNWKLKHISLQLHKMTANGAATPALRDCESLQPLLSIEQAPMCSVEEVE